MPLPRVYRVIQDSLGNVVPQVLCSVLNEGTGVLATLWQDDAATIPLSNPMTSDATYGSFGFYVEPGHYDLTFTKPGYVFQPQLDMQVPQDDLTLGTMAQQNAGSVAITGGDAQLQNLGINTPVDPIYRVAINGPSIQTGGSTRVQQLGVNITPPSDVQVMINVLKNAGFGLVLHTGDADLGANATVLFTNVAGGIIGSITTNATATAYNTSSDVRLKHAIAPLTGALDVVQALKPVHFFWNAHDEPGEGFLAHELMRHVPAAVTGQPDEVNEDGSIRPQGVDHSRLVPWLTACCQELAAQVQALTARVAALEGATP